MYPRSILPVVERYHDEIQFDWDEDQDRDSPLQADRQFCDDVVDQTDGLYTRRPCVPHSSSNCGVEVPRMEDLERIPDGMTATGELRFGVVAHLVTEHRRDMSTKLARPRRYNSKLAHHGACGGIARVGHSST